MAIIVTRVIDIVFMLHFDVMNVSRKKKIETERWGISNDSSTRQKGKEFVTIGPP